MHSKIPNGRGDKSEIVQLKMRKKYGLFAYREHLYQMKHDTDKYTLYICHNKSCKAAIKLWKRGGEVTIVREDHIHETEEEKIRAISAKVLFVNNEECFR